MHFGPIYQQNLKLNGQARRVCTLLALLILSSWSWAQTSVPPSAVTSSIVKMKTWMEQAEDPSTKTVALSNFPSGDLNILLENYRDPLVTEFIKRNNVLVRMTYLKPAVSKKIVSLGLISSDKGVREPAKNLLRMLTKPTEKELKDPNSYFNSVAKSYLLNYPAQIPSGGDYTSAKVRNAIMRTYKEELFSGHPYSQTSENSMTLLRVRLSSAEALSQIHHRKPLREKDLLIKWYEERDPLSSSSDLLAIMKEKNLSDREMSESQSRRNRRLAREVVCAHWSYPTPKPNYGTYFTLAKSLKPSLEGPGEMGPTEFVKFVATVEMDSHAHRQLRLKWPYLLGQLNLDMRTKPNGQAHFLEALDWATRLCHMNVKKDSTTQRCVGTCLDQSCDNLDDIKGNVNEFLAEFAKHQDFVGGLTPSGSVRAAIDKKINRLEKSKSRIQQQISDLTAAGSDEKSEKMIEARRDLRRLDDSMADSSYTLEGDDMEACLDGRPLHSTQALDGEDDSTVNQGVKQ